MYDDHYISVTKRSEQPTTAKQHPSERIRTKAMVAGRPQSTGTPHSSGTTHTTGVPAQIVFFFKKKKKNVLCETKKNQKTKVNDQKLSYNK
jgi:hypothetical protein